MTSAILVNVGRDAFITYFRNTVASPQTDKLYLKEFHLLTGIPATVAADKVWGGGGGLDISPYLLTGLVGAAPTAGSFAISNRTQESGYKLRLHLVVPNNFNTDTDDIDGVAVVFENQSGTIILAGYGTFTPFSKPAGIDLTLYFDISF